jgi:hypothetical protein
MIISKDEASEIRDLDLIMMPHMRVWRLALLSDAEVASRSELRAI